MQPGGGVGYRCHWGTSRHAARRGVRGRCRRAPGVASAAKAAIYEDRAPNAPKALGALKLALQALGDKVFRVAKLLFPILSIL